MAMENDEKLSRIVEELVKSGMSIDRILMTSVRQGDLEMVKFAVKKGADVNFRDHMGDDPLMSALLLGDVKIAEFLIENGADVNAKNIAGRAALVNELILEGTEIGRLLMEKQDCLLVAEIVSDGDLI